MGVGQVGFQAYINCVRCGADLIVAEAQERAMIIKQVQFETNEYKTLCGNWKTIVRLPEKIRLFQKRLNLRRERVKKWL